MNEEIYKWMYAMLTEEYAGIHRIPVLRYTTLHLQVC